ncbi:MAG TPA: discoidin domain-containing protein [Saprospiraceae bacterium]|nr:discoidin domain-containing protein [Saprospiraceae bacterium]HMQ85545.1 discoidin domain-containing protein [Saprospiraceae bacterium]
MEKHTSKIQYQATTFSAAIALLALFTFNTATAQNLALHKHAEQSSSYSHSMGLASNAVDGNTDGNWANGSVTHTTQETQPWWEVDLGSAYDLQQIRVWNRTDCCSERLDYVTVCLRDENYNVVKYLEHQASTKGVQVIDFNNVQQKARYVMVYVDGTQYLSLAEVEVYGQGVSTPTAGTYEVKVSLDDVTCIASGDGNGDATEYYGSIWVSERTMTGGHWTRDLYKASNSNTFDLSAGVSQLFPGAYAVYQVSAPNGLGNVADELVLHAQLMDYDSTSGDDNCGFGQQTVRINTLSPGTKKEYTINLANDGDQSRVRFAVSVTKIR